MKMEDGALSKSAKCLPFELPGTRPEVSQQILDLFWGLAATDEDVRMIASAQLMSALDGVLKCDKSGDDAEDEGVCETPAVLNYVVRRLVLGLSSSRQAAPLGFATSLCEVFKQFGSYLHVTDLLETIRRCLQASKQDNRCHQTHSGLGRILAYICLIRSGLIQEATPADLRIMIKSISTVRTRFTTLATVTTEALILLCSTMSLGDVGELVMEIFEEELSSGWEKCSPDTLQLALVLQEKGVVDADFLTQHWGTDSLVAMETLPHLAQIIIKGTANHPLIHPLNSLLVERAAHASNKILTKLWKNVFTGEVYNAEKPARCYMLYQMIPEVLRRHASSPRIISTILCPQLIGPVMKQMTHRDTYLHQAGVKLMSDVVEVVKTYEDSPKQLAVLKCLLSEPGSFMFDSITSTRYLSKIISHLTFEAAIEFRQDLMDAISKDAGLCGRRGEGLVSWCSVTLTHMLTLGSVMQQPDDVTRTWQTDILKFLLLHSCFAVRTCQSRPVQCDALTLNEGETAALADALRKGLSVMSTHRVQRGESAGSEYSAILHILFTYACELVNSSKHVKVLRPLDDEEQKTWTRLERTCGQICKKKNGDVCGGDGDKSRLGMYNAFLLMLELFGLLMLIIDRSERGEAVETINEIHACFDKAVSKSSTTSKELEWCEVITEVLISLMAKPSLLLRSVSSNVFSKILPMCNVAAIRLILDVFETEDDEFEADGEGMEEEEEEEEEEGDAAMDNEGSAEQNDDDGGSEPGSSSSEESEESEEEGDVDETMRAVVQAALGSAAVIKDTDEEGDDDLSDSEMFKLDDALSEAFRSMRRRTKNSPEELEKKRQIKHFKLRCLDLVDATAKHTSKGEHLMEIVVPLLTLIEAGYKDKNLKEIGDKAHTIHNHLILNKKLPVCCVADPEETQEKVRAVLALSTNAYVWPIMKEISKTLHFMIKLLSHTAAKPVDNTKKTKTARKEAKRLQEDRPFLADTVVCEVHGALRDFLTKRESRYSHTLFQTLFEKQPVLFWRCSVDLVESICDADIRIFYRTQACSLLMQLLHRNIKKEVDESTWKGFSMSLVNGTAKVASYSAENYKPGFLTEFFGVLQRAKAVDRTLVMDMSIFEPLSSTFSRDLQKLHRKLSHLYGSSSGRQAGPASSSIKRSNAGLQPSQPAAPPASKKAKIVSKK